MNRGRWRGLRPRFSCSPSASSLIILTGGTSQLLVHCSSMTFASQTRNLESFSQHFSSLIQQCSLLSAGWWIASTPIAYWQPDFYFGQLLPRPPELCVVLPSCWLCASFLESAKL